MIANTQVRESLKNCVLCWLATASREGVPNVSPKEIFALYEDDCLIIANIASPRSVKNIIENGYACVSFIDILVQKGFKVVGQARLVDKSDLAFEAMYSVLGEKANGKFPFDSIIEVKLDAVKEVLAPRYILYPDTKEEDQIESAKKLYGL